MPLATRHRDDPAPALPPLDGLVVRQLADADAMAAVQGRSADEMAARLADGHRAYVAFRDGEPAAFGWVATRSATIGELGATFTIPEGERYLWNFVTRPAHRGLGIYPRLLEAIIRAEGAEASRFWVAYAPENHASAAGIHRAGFATVADLSFDGERRPAVRPRDGERGARAAAVVGLPVAPEPLAPCWRCVRAGRPGMTCAPGACRCDYQVPASGCAA
jgi:GNAT superfamily N-acetyltransferase